MKPSIRLTSLAIAAAAFAGVLGAQSRSSHAAPRAQARPQARPQARQQVASRAQPERFASENVRAQHFAPERYAPQRAETRVRTDVQVRNDYRGRAGVAARADFRAVPAAAVTRPLITRAYVQPRVYGRSPVYGAARFGPRGFIPRVGLPIGWEGRIVFHGFFPLSYASYCDAVPPGYDYLLPPMIPAYDPCLFGDRLVVFDRFSRSIVFVATI